MCIYLQVSPMLPQVLGSQPASVASCKKTQFNVASRRNIHVTPARSIRVCVLLLHSRVKYLRELFEAWADRGREVTDELRYMFAPRPSFMREPSRQVRFSGLRRNYTLSHEWKSAR